MSALTETTVDVTSQATYPTTPQVTAGFEPDEWLFIANSDTGLAKVHFSFDGVHDHAPIDPARFIGIKWKTKSKKVWFRRDTAGADTVTITVTASTDV